MESMGKKKPRPRRSFTPEFKAEIVELCRRGDRSVGIEHGSGLGVYRWVVEGTIALLHWFRRLRIRWEIRDDIHHAFVTLGCALICWRRLKLSL